MEIAIGAALISTILKPMAELATVKAKTMVVHKVDGIVNIERDITKLQTTLSMIEAVVQEAEENQINEQGKPVVFIQNWLRDLVDIAYEARDVLDDFITFSSCTITAEEASKPVNTISSNILKYLKIFSSTYDRNRIANHIRSVRKRFDKKMKDGKTFKELKSVVGGGSKSVPVDGRTEVGCFIYEGRDDLVLGRKKTKEEIMEKILNPSDDNTVHVVTIQGMGGIGKTNLAQSIYNDVSVQKVPRIWLSVGEKNFSAEKVIRKILNYEKTISIADLQKNLVEKLSGKKFLIVLDDVCNVDGTEWDKLFIPLNKVGKGGLIIITKTGNEVCTELKKIQTVYYLDLLSEQDSWSIFERHAFVNGKYNVFDSTRELKGIGEDIVRKLNGHPLALKVVGSSLWNKDLSTWKDFLQSKEWTLIKDNEVMPALRWSYNLLPQHLKMCFTYCALFPKGHVLDKKLLVEIWMAHDLIQTEEAKNRPEKVGADYFEDLVNASLLQCVDEKNVMHDLIHDLALLVSKGEFSSAVGSLSTNQMKKVRHITIPIDNEYSKNLSSCKSKKILTVYTPYKHQTCILDNDILPEVQSKNIRVFKHLKSIRVLVLVSKKIVDIPDSINKLRHLRYLDVSRTAVTSLPNSLCRLYNLQMLAAPLEAKLPSDIVNISGLRYVRAHLSRCKGVRKLTSLQELSSIHICKGDNISELADMKLLQGKLRIEGLENVTSLEDATWDLMKDKSNLEELELEFSGNLRKSSTVTDVLDALGCPPYLKYLRIAGYTGVKPPSWMADGKFFTKLQTLQLSECRQFEFLQLLGEMSYLEVLGINGCWKIKLLDFSCLRSLRLLFVSHCYELVSISGLVAVRELLIRNCKKLTSVSTNFHGLDFIEDLSIHYCPLLNSINKEKTSSSSSSSPSSSSSSSWSRLRKLEMIDNEQVLRNIFEQVHISNIEYIGITGNKELLVCLGEIMNKLVSLECLVISGCPELESLPDGFPPSLRYFKIRNCPKVQLLPVDGFPSFLISLEIEGCPFLYELYNDNSGSYRHRIEHIPRKDILP